MGTTTRTPIRVGIVGAGMMGKTHSTAWANVSSFYWPDSPQVIKLRLAEATAELAQQGAARLGWRESTGDWHEVTEASDIDIVDVVVPNALHADVVLSAVRHGKHVLCEKPLSTDLGAARVMYAEAEKAGIVHQTGFVYRSYPSIALARKLIADGRIGDVRYFRGQWLSDWAADPRVAYGWRFSREMAGAGVLADTGSHVIDLARFLVGDEVARVLARGRTYITKRPLPTDPSGFGVVDTDDLTDIMVDFDKGAIGTICLARTYPGHNTDMGFEVVGSRGSVRFSWLHMNELQFYTMDDPEEIRAPRTILVGAPMHPNAQWFYGRGVGMGYHDAFTIEIHSLVDAVQHQKPVSASFLDGVRAEEVIHAALGSFETGGWVDVQRYDPH